MSQIARQSGSRQWAEQEFELAPSTARTADGTGDGVDVSASLVAVAELEVTAASGTSPSLDVKVVGVDGEKTVELGKFAQQIAAGSVGRIAVPLPYPEARAEWTIGGTTPSFTFSVKIVAARR